MVTYIWLRGQDLRCCKACSTVIVNLTLSFCLAVSSNNRATFQHAILRSPWYQSIAPSPVAIKLTAKNCLFARSLKLDTILKLNLIETNFDFRESNRGNDFETYNKVQKSASAAQLNYGARCCRCNECAIGCGSWF